MKALNKFFCNFFLLLITFLIVSCESIVDKPNQPIQPDEAITAKNERMGILVIYMDPGIEHARADSVLTAAKELGIKWIRIGFIWEVMNMQRDVYDFKEIDWIIERACYHGLSILPIFTWTPYWASSNKLNLSQYMCYAPTSDKIGDYDAGLGTVGTGYDYMAKFIETVSRRYKDKISHWELWNEPDMYGFFNSSVDEYCKMLYYFNHAIKKGNPDAKIVFGGLAQGNKAWGCDTEFFQKALYNTEYPIHDNFDIYNFHVNFKNSNDIRNQISENKALLSNNNLQKRYWITEVSYTSDSNKQTLSGYQNGEESLGNYIYTVYREILLNSDAEVVFWAALHDYIPSMSESDPYKYSGLYTFDLKLKKGGLAMKETARDPLSP